MRRLQMWKPRRQYRRTAPASPLQRAMARRNIRKAHLMRVGRRFYGGYRRR